MATVLGRIRAALLESNPASLFQAFAVVSHHRFSRKPSWLVDAATSASHQPAYVLYPQISKSPSFPPSISDLIVLWKFLWLTIRPLNCLLLALAGWATVPACRSFYLQCTALRCYYSRPHQCCLYGDDLDEEMSDLKLKAKQEASLQCAFEDSYLFQLADHISQVARLSTVVFAADCILKILVGLGVCGSLQAMDNLSWGFAKILYIAWAAQRLAVLKRFVLGQMVEPRCSRASNVTKQTLPSTGGRQVQQQPMPLRGQASVVDRLLDGIIFVCTVMLLLDILDVEMGVGVTSMFAFGSAGTLIVGLASRDLASMLVNGLALSTTNRFVQGEHVKFGDGTVGAVHKIGWFETTIRNYDNLLEIVPNNELGMQRVRNISRCTVCQIKQTLRFHYDDAEKLPQCLNDILEEIKLSCKDVITDGSKPFRATWRHYRATHLEIVVDTHHFGKPIGKKYFNDVQDVNMAIFRAVKRNGVRFVTDWSPFDELGGIKKK